jgi:protein-L-isoaspartate(D-aspartate) O-methyltransferase
MLGQEGERVAHLNLQHQVELCWDEDQDIEPSALLGVLDQPQTSAWSGATVGSEEPFDGVWLRLTVSEPGTCRITVAPQAVDAGLLCRPAIPARSPALVEGDSLAYLVLRRLTPEGSPAGRWELGAAAYGPAGAQLVERLCDQIRAWDRARAQQPVITAYRAEDADAAAGRRHLIDKRTARLTISY